MKICKVDGCNNKYRCKGYCNRHYLQYLKYGETLAPPKQTICKVNGCDGKHYAKGYCSKHYDQFRKYGEELAPSKKTICSVEGCTGKHFALGLCRKHYHQMRDYGHILERTIFDKNEIIIDEDNDCAYMVIYNRQCEEVARAIIDIEDIDLVKNHKWYLRNGYIHNTKVGSLHRFLLNPKDDEVVDHINNNPSDNRRRNLRICTAQQNSMNRLKHKRNTTSIYKGVYFDKKNKKWKAVIRINNKLKYIGHYDSELEASISYDKAAILYHSVYCNLNHPISNYIEYIKELGLNPSDFDIDESAE